MYSSRDAAANEYVESLARSKQPFNADTLEPDVGRVVIAARRGATAHVNANAMQLHQTLPQLLDELQCMRFGFGDGDIAEK